MSAHSTVRIVGGLFPAQLIERIANGTNVTRVRLPGVDLSRLATRLAARGVELPHPAPDGAMMFGVNESWNRTTGPQLAAAFVQAMG